MAKHKEEQAKEADKKVIIELVKAEAKQLAIPIPKDKYNMVFFTEHNFIVIHKLGQYSGPESIVLPVYLILLSEIKSMEKIVEKRVLALTVDNKATYTLYFRKAEKLDLIEEIISKKIKIMSSFYDSVSDKDRTWAKYHTAAYFESIYRVDNLYVNKYKALLTDDVFEYFTEAIENTRHNVLHRKLWFGKFKKYERTFRIDNLKELLKEIKGKNLVDREALGVLVTHKQLVNYSDEPFENYMDLYFDILGSEYLPRWMDINHLYLFKIDKLVKDDTFSKVSPFFEFISLM